MSCAASSVTSSSLERLSGQRRRRASLFSQLSLGALAAAAPLDAVASPLPSWLGPAPPAVAASAAATSARVLLVAAGAYSAYALTAGGQVWAWGDGLEGQLGDGLQYTMSVLPVPVRGLSGVSQLAASFNTAYAVRNRQVWAWGDDAQGQAGSGTAGYAQDRPQLVHHLAEVRAVAAGGYSAYALGARGQLWAWGDNSSGQLGLRLSVAGSTTPRAISLGRLGRVAAIAASTSTAYALGHNGTLWAWGDNAFGEAGGAATKTETPVPVAVPGLGKVVAVAANGFTGFGLLRDGTVWAWGDNSFGELGPGPCRSTGGGARAGGAHTGKAGAGGCTASPWPKRVPGLDGVTAIAAGGESAYALGAGGTVWAWGNNTYGQLGDGTTRSSPTPVRVTGLRHIVALAAGGTSAYALGAGGVLWAWGNNTYGQLGDGTIAPSDVPIRVKL